MKNKNNKTVKAVSLGGFETNWVTGEWTDSPVTIEREEDFLHKEEVFFKRTCNNVQVRKVC